MTEAARKSSTKKMLIQFLIGLPVGAAIGFVMVRYGPEIEAPGTHMPGLFVAALLLVFGLVIMGASLTGAGAARLIGPELEPGDDIGSELKPLRWQGLVTLLAGIELAILSLATDILTGPWSPILLALLAVNLAVQTGFNVVLWRRGDELFRRVIVEAGVIGFFVFQFLLLFWVVGARFELVSDPSALDIYVLMMVLYLLGSGIASVRRGYGTPS